MSDNMDCTVRMSDVLPTVIPRCVSIIMSGCTSVRAREILRDQIMNAAVRNGWRCPNPHVAPLVYVATRENALKDMQDLILSAPFVVKTPDGAVYPPIHLDVQEEANIPTPHDGYICVIKGSMLHVRERSSYCTACGDFLDGYGDDRPSVRDAAGNVVCCGCVRGITMKFAMDNKCPFPDIDTKTMRPV